MSSPLSLLPSPLSLSSPTLSLSPPPLSLFRRNIPERANNKSYLSGCEFDPKTEMGKFCPIFTLKQIVDMIDSRDGYYESLATLVSERMNEQVSE